MSGEFERIARLRAIYGDAHEGVALGIGDDAAILEPGIVLSVDAAVEGVHFRRGWVSRGATWEDIGRRATVAALSDLAAMGATPRATLQALTLPDETPDEIVDGLA
nr:AIR synthase related protein [Myxococcota bacterium]